MFLQISPPQPFGQTSLERTYIMIFGMTTATFTLVHVVLSLIGIGSGFVVIFGLLSGRGLKGWTAVFLASTVLTSVTGFGFPFHQLSPALYVGIISLVVLVAAILARYAFHLAGGWRRIYVISSVIALYFNVFVAIVQAFEKVPALRAVAPKQSEPPFVVTQLAVVVLFVVLGKMASSRFRSEPLRTATS
jgi:hypothetical protein